MSTTSRFSRARGHLKSAARGLGVATSEFRALPDFLIIGAKRGGSTSFYFDLIEHPSILRMYPPPVPGLKRNATKGVHYFDSNFEKGNDWYRSYFPTRLRRSIASRAQGSPGVTGEASPYYLFHPCAPDRAHEVVPDARVIAVLRDPIQRTYSHWKERRRAGMEPLDFVDALDAEPQRLEGERERLLSDPSYYSYAWEQQSYATQSEYVTSLEPWIKHFGIDKMLILASEDYYRDPVTALAEADRFLGIRPRTTSSGKIRNAASGSELSAPVLERLRQHFREPNRRLGALIGRQFPWM